MNCDGFPIEMPDPIPIPQASKPQRWLLSACVRFGSVLLVALTAIALIRLGPGFENDERDLDATLSKETRAALHAQKRAEVQTFILGVLHGNLGESKALGISVRELIAQRGPATLRILLSGILGAWAAALLWAFALAIWRAPLIAQFSTIVTAALLCLPAAAVAALLIYADIPAALVLAIALVPKIFQMLRTLVCQAMDHSEVLAARARGLRTTRILACYVLPRIAAPLLAWFAATVGMAIGAVVPIEVICDVPGLGQLAWKAALARDLPVLVILTSIVAVITQLTNGASSLAVSRMKEVRA